MLQSQGNIAVRLFFFHFLTLFCWCGNCCCSPTETYQTWALKIGLRTNTQILLLNRQTFHWQETDWYWNGRYFFHVHGFWMCAFGTFTVIVSIGLTIFIVSFIFIFQDLVFAVLISNNQLVTLVRLKQFVLHPQDLHILLNMVQASDAFKDAESWLPVCLPKFDSR